MKNVKYRTLGAKMPLIVFDLIRKKGLTPTMYIRKLIYDDIKKTENISINVVISGVNEETDSDKTTDIHVKVDRLLDGL